MRIKAYGYNNWWHQEDYSDVTFDLIPMFRMSVTRYDFEPDENCSYRRKGGELYIMFGWLLWGFTLDFRFGTGTMIRKAKNDRS